MKSKNGTKFSLQKYIYFIVCVPTAPWNSEWAIGAAKFSKQNIQLASAQMNNYFKATKPKEEKPPQDYTGQLFRCNLQRLISSVFPKLMFYGCQRNKNSIKTWVVQNVQVQKCACQIQPRQLPWTENIYDKYQQPENKHWKTRNFRKITKVLPYKLVNISHRPAVRIFHNCIASN